MISYLRQVTICESLRKMIKKGLSQGDDMGIRLKANDIPLNESILRGVSLLPTLDTEEKLKDHIIEQMLGSLRLTAAQKERLNLNPQESVNPSSD